MGRKPLEVVGQALDKPQRAPRVGRRAAPEEPKLPLLPAGCPVTPLGKLGQNCSYLDELGQLITLNPRDHGKGHIISLFGRQAALCHQFWPRYSDKRDQQGEPIITGWRPEDAAEQLQGACAHAGLFDPQGRVRGRGAHPGEDGALILHLGDVVFNSAGLAGRKFIHLDRERGLIDGFVYPTAPAMPRPDPEPVGDEVGQELLALVRKWFWQRPKIDPYLLVGFIAAARVGGAMTWRSHVWTTGDSSTGKSTLEKEVLAPLFEGQSLRTNSATEAAIRQILGQQTLPVFFDELEPDVSNERAMAVIKLARLASSGGVIFKGGSDHQGHEFTAKSSFYFSSILLPPMLSQDRNRLAILELDPIPPGAEEPAIDRAEIRALGARISRRICDQWHLFEETLALYRRALASRGHTGRSADQFGGLLAAAHLLMWDGLPEEELLAGWAEALRADELAEMSENQSDSEEACDFLATKHLQLRGGDPPEPLSRFLERALGDGSAILSTECEKARKTLEDHGLRLVAAVDKGEGKACGAKDPVAGEPVFLAIANKHEALAQLFRDKRWAQGVWSQTFARVPGAKRRVQVRFAQRPMKATLVPIEALIERGEAAP